MNSKWVIDLNAKSKESKKRARRRGNLVTNNPLLYQSWKGTTAMFKVKTELPGGQSRKGSTIGSIGRQKTQNYSAP